MILTIKDQSELALVAATLLEEYPDNRVYTLKGDLGAGKTSFVKAFLQHIASTDEVSSPTFSIVNEYRSADNRPIYHMDLYRLQSVEELIDLGFEEYLDDCAYCFIEWPTLGEHILDDYVELRIEALEDDARQFTIEQKSV